MVKIKWIPEDHPWVRFGGLGEHATTSALTNGEIVS
jgi:hypothetical protein